MRRLMRFLKLADSMKDSVGLKSLCVQFDSFMKKHGHYIPHNDGTTPNPWRHNMDYSSWESSPYFGSVSEFMEKFPGGIKDWIEWRRKTQEERFQKWDPKKKASFKAAADKRKETYENIKQSEPNEIDYMGEETTDEEHEKAFDLIAKHIEMYKEMFGITDEEIKAWIESKYGKISIAHFLDVKKDKTKDFPKEPHLWSGDGPGMFKSIVQFLKKYRSQNAVDSDAAAEKAVKDFINYWKLLKSKGK